MAKFRMVPNDAEEAKFIAHLIADDNAAKLPELSKDLKLLRKRLEWAERWEEIAADLADEEAMGREEADSIRVANQGAPAPKPPRGAGAKMSADKPATETTKA